ncbi:hypothetical protein Tco_1323357, partial [Tanacetum coccineum]
MMMTYGNNVSKMIRKVESLGGVPCQIHNTRCTGAPSLGSKDVQMKVQDALNSALDEEMAADPNVFVMGEQ